MNKNDEIKKLKEHLKNLSSKKTFSMILLLIWNLLQE